MLWETMHDRAQLFAKMEILPHNECQEVQELVSWFVEGDRTTISIRPFMDYFHNMSAPVLPNNCSLPVLDSFDLRPNTYLNDDFVCAILANVCIQEHVTVAHLLPYTSDKMSEQLVRAMRGGSTRVIFTLRHRDLDSRCRNDAQPDSRRRDAAQLDSRRRDHARLDHASSENASLDDTATINQDHRFGIFVDITSLKCYVYNPLGKEHSSTTWAIKQTQAALHLSDFTFKVKYMKLASDQMMVTHCDCGVFLVAAASNWIRGLSMPREHEIAAYRLELITRFTGNHEKAPTTLMDNVDEDEVVFVGQTTGQSTQIASNLHSTEGEGKSFPALALAPRRSTQKPTEKCTPQAGTSFRDTQPLLHSAERQRTSGSASRGGGDVNTGLDLAKRQRTSGSVSRGGKKVNSESDSEFGDTIPCPANHYSKVATCPKRLPRPTSRANVRIFREHIHACHPSYTMNVRHFPCRCLEKSHRYGLPSREVFCSKPGCMALILPPYSRAAHVNDASWPPGKDLIETTLGDNQRPSRIPKSNVTTFINWFRQSSMTRP